MWFPQVPRDVTWPHCSQKLVSVADGARGDLLIFRYFSVHSASNGGLCVMSKIFDWAIPANSWGFVHPKLSFRQIIQLDDFSIALSLCGIFGRNKYSILFRCKTRKILKNWKAIRMSWWWMWMIFERTQNHALSIFLDVVTQDDDSISLIENMLSFFFSMRARQAWKNSHQIV